MKKVAKNGSQEGKKKGKKLVDSNRDKRTVKYPGGESRDRVPEELWFAQNIKTVREHWGWDQKSMAKHLRMTQPSYSNIEHHRRSLKLNSISFIAHQVKIPVHQMLVDPEEFTVIKKISTAPKRPT